MEITSAFDGLSFPEGPRWYGSRLWVSDIYGRRVVSWSPGNVPAEVAQVPGRPSGLGFLPDGSLLIVSMQDGRVLVRRQGALTEFADCSPYGVGNRGSIVNDMVVAEDGTTYVGVYGAGGDADNSGILLIGLDGRPELVADGLALANGMAITPDGRTLLVAELGSDRIAAFRIRGDGTLADRRVWAQVPGMTPDGLCLDVEGAAWVGSAYTEQFIRVAEGGEVLGEITMPGRLTTATALGGEHGTTLFLTSAIATAQERARGISRGYVDYVEVDVPGAGWP